MWVYCDSSVLVKRYVRENGRVELARALKRARVVSSTVTWVELHSAISRRARDGTLSTAAVPQLLERMARDRESWTLITPGASVIRAAEDVVSEHAIKTLDALQIASARVFAARLKGALAFLTADKRQQAVAERCGLAARTL